SANNASGRAYLARHTDEHRRPEFLLRRARETLLDASADLHDLFDSPRALAHRRLLPARPKRRAQPHPRADPLAMAQLAVADRTIRRHLLDHLHDVQEQPPEPARVRRRAEFTAGWLLQRRRLLDRRPAAPATGHRQDALARRDPCWQHVWQLNDA